MNIDDKQRLWSKYYLTHSAYHDDMASLKEFVDSEISALHLPDNVAMDKKRKTIKSMLKFLPKKHILKKYCKLDSTKFESKNAVITYLIRYI